MSTRAPARSSARTDPLSTGLRLALTVIGAGGMILGAFLVWLRSPKLTGVQLNYRIFYSFYLGKGTSLATRTPPHSRPLTSAGIVLILLGVVAVAGLLPRRGWLTSVAGLAAVVAMVLFAATLKGADVRPRLHLRSSVGAGAVICGVGGVIALVGGFFGGRRRSRSKAG